MIHAEITLESRLAGAAWGLLVGDAVGVPYEFGAPVPADEVRFGHRGTWGQPAGTWSDDGALMLALLDSLLEAGPDPADQGARALAWRDRGAYTPDGDGRFDIGGTTSAALDRLARGVPALDAGPADERACGNGSLMRILPVALVLRDAPPDALAAAAEAASRVTHGHPRCQAACAVYALAVAGLLRGVAPAAALASAFEAAASRYASADGMAAHAVALDELRTYPQRRGGGFVLDAFWSAWDAFAAAGTYDEAIRRAVAYGNDTDTTAAIAGGLAGARFGWQGLPRAWREGMRGREVATPLVDRLVATAGARTSTASPLRVDWVGLAGVPGLAGAAGRVGITFLPGKKLHGWSGRHWRNLDEDLARLRAERVDVLLLLVEDAELEICRVPELPERMAADHAAGLGPALLRHPVNDPHTPRDHARYRADVHGLVERVRAGQTVAIACRGGIDRSGMTASCLLVEAGLAPDAAIARVQGARRGSITRPDEQAYVRSWPHAPLAGEAG